MVVPIRKRHPGPSRRTRIPRPWALSPDDVLEQLAVDLKTGLDSREVAGRRLVYGSNYLKEVEAKGLPTILIDQFKSLIVVLLAGAAIVSFLFGEWLEGGAILVVIAINSAIGFVTELRAVRSMEALRQLGRVVTKVRRDGVLLEVPAENLVPGDIVILEGGDIVTADLRIAAASKLQADESTLTGESFPVGKRVRALPGDVPLAERTNMLYKGTHLTRGTGEAIVVATGMNTELGQISSLVQEAKEEVTPLEKRLDSLGKRLIWATLIVVAIVAVAGILSGREALVMVETAIALAVATVPEGLPIVATIALARGMVRMARRNALINRLSAVETLGGTTVICTDKTGTLTENRMTVTRFDTILSKIDVLEEIHTGSWFARDGTPIDPMSQGIVKEAIEIGVLCNNASIQSDDLEGKAGVGDPLEVALLAVASKAGVRREKLLNEAPEEREEAFDSDVKMMATFHREKDSYRVAVKGAPEAVLASCSSVRMGGGKRDMTEEDRENLLKHNVRMARRMSAHADSPPGLRVLAIATKMVQDIDSNPYEDLTFVALVGLRDPPRKDVPESIESCRSSGIRVVMATGDQPATALDVALEVGLVDNTEAEVLAGHEIKSPETLSPEERKRLLGASIFARVTPKQKLDLIDLHQGDGQIVAMTGDGVNDAPALKKADIGIAMGLRGTQVAREAADMVLKDDSFPTIVSAVEQGRIIFDNIRKVVFFLLSCNLSEIMVVSLASVLNAPLPLLPLQILFLNLVTDVFPALALATGEGDRAIMKRHPRNPKEPILTRDNWLMIVGYGSVMMVSVLAALLLASSWLGMVEERAVTVSFLTLAFAQLWHVFNMRDQGSDLIRNEITRNPFIWASLALCAFLLISAVHISGLSVVLKTADVGLSGWALVGAMSSIVFIVGQLHKSMATPDS